MKSTIALLSCSVFLISNQAYADVTLGLVGPLTGKYAVMGEQMKRGAEQAGCRYQRQGRREW